jgi:hypothetical protein
MHLDKQHSGNSLKMECAVDRDRVCEREVVNERHRVRYLESSMDRARDIFLCQQGQLSENRRFHDQEAR